MIQIKSESRRNDLNVNSDRKVTIEGKEYDLSNVSALASTYSGTEYSTMTITNYVSREGTGVDTRSAFEKAHSHNNSSRYTFTVPFNTNSPEMMAMAKTVEEALEDYLRNSLSKFIKDNGIVADREQMIRSEAYRRAKRDATYTRTLSEAERDNLIGDLMPKKKNQGTFALNVRVSVRNDMYYKPNSPAWRDVEGGKAGVYNAYGVGKCPLTSGVMVTKAEILSKEVANMLLPAIAGKSDLTQIWKDLVEVVKKLPNVPKATETYEFTAKEENQIEEIKMKMIQRLGVGGN